MFIRTEKQVHGIGLGFDNPYNEEVEKSCQSVYRQYDNLVAYYPSRCLCPICGKEVCLVLTLTQKTLI